MTTTSITRIVRHTPEPSRSAQLRALLEQGTAVVLEYRPRPGCPAYRRERVSIPYGIPEKRVIFEAGKPRAVSIGIASMILHQFRTQDDQEAGGWYDEEWVEVSDQILRPKEEPETFETSVARAEAREKLAKASTRRPAEEELVERPAAPSEDETTEPEKPAEVELSQDKQYLSSMRKDELALIHDEEIGPVPSGLKRVEILRRIQAHRNGAPIEDVDESAPPPEAQKV